MNFRRFVFALSVIFFIFSLFTLTNSAWQKAASERLFPPQRKVLSIVRSDIFSTGEIFSVLKILDQNKIHIEIYHSGVDNTRRLWARLTLPDRRDAGFNINDQVSRLTLKDLDGDGVKEILAPTYDSQMNPHLNALRLNKETQQIEAYAGKIP